MITYQTGTAIILIPDTGGIGTYPFIISGLLLLAIAAVVIVRRRKRKKEEDSTPEG